MKFFVTANSKNITAALRIVTIGKFGLAFGWKSDKDDTLTYHRKGKKENPGDIFFFYQMWCTFYTQITYNTKMKIQYKNITTHALNLMDYNPKSFYYNRTKITY